MKVTLIIDDEKGKIQRFDAEDNTLFALGLVGQVTKAAIAANNDELLYVIKLIQAFAPVIAQVKSLMDWPESGTPDGVQVDVTEVPDGAGCGEGVVT